MNQSLKPQGLVTFQAWLARRPIRRAALWAATCFFVMELLTHWRGHEATLRGVLIHGVCWAVGGVLFWLVMHWSDARDAR